MIEKEKKRKESKMSDDSSSSGSNPGTPVSPAENQAGGSPPSVQGGADSSSSSSSSSSVSGSASTSGSIYGPSASIDQDIGSVGFNTDSMDITELIDVSRDNEFDSPSRNDANTQGQILSDFLHQLEEYTPTIPDAVTSYFCQTAGFEASDPRIVRLISIAAQKFVSDVANDALQHCKTRTSNTPNSHSSSKNPKTQNAKDRKYTLTMDDLAPALSDYGITVRKAHYFV